MKACAIAALFSGFVNLGAYAQAPTISYSSPQTYFPGTAITPLAPVSSGVATMAYSNTPAVFGSGFNSVYGVASDPTGNVYITDPVAGQIKKIPAGGGAPIVLLSGIVAQLKDIAVDTLGNIFFTNFSHNVNELAAGSAKATTIKDFIQTPWGVAADNNGRVFVADNGRGQVDQIITGLGGGSGSAGNLPTGIAVDAADRLYIANEGTNTSIKGPVGSIGSGFNQANGVAVDFSGNVYVADQGNNAVKMVAAGSNTPVSIGSGFSSPTGVAVDGAGNVYVADNGNNQLKKISPVGGYFISPTLLPPGLSFNNNTGVISGTPTGSFAKKKYTITAYNSFGSASASVIIDVQHSVDLTEISINGNPGTTFSPAFSPSVTKYNVGVDSAIHQIGVSAATVDATATFTIAGFVSAQNYVIGVNLHKGLNIVPIVVTSKDGLSSKTYTLYVTRGPLTANADLAALTVGGGSHLTPYFSPLVTSYTDTVAYNHLAVTITPTANDPLATITVNGTAVASGATSASIPLKEGPNTITTVVTAEDGVTTKTYTLTVFRAFSSDANLSFMQPTAGMMSPIFTPLITSYKDTVNYTNLAMQITPIADDPLAAIKVNGKAVTSGSMSQAIALKEGLNTITTIVTAPDGHTTKTFTISVMRAFSTDAFLTQIQPSAGVLSPVFNPMVTGYADAVNNSNASITITPIVHDPLATLTVNGAALASGATSAAIPLTVGSNTITIVVTAPDGVTIKTYTVTVNRAAFPLAALNSDYQPVGVAKALTDPALADDGLLVHQELSPNGDGINDFLVIENISQYPDNKLTIMNRNGQLIFEVKGYDNSSKVFDGHSNKNGQMQLPGTYFYQLDYTVKGVTRHKTGFVVLKY